MSDPITPDTLRELADGVTVGDLIDHNLRAAADTIEAQDRVIKSLANPGCLQCAEDVLPEYASPRLGLCAGHREALTVERDEAVALLLELVEACAYNGRGGNADYKAVWVKAHNFVSPRRVVAFLARQEAEG